ncbi:LysR family transcriptional regulator [Oceanicola sp. S124]|uniref:LysR family transcriptional regulator n=1 Tax=Oceanicola sp. S124 TaxID=1042378 RepID=UPI0002557963|nr:LysR family transcriptional regulator [Oceanicola sp. S124]
MALSHLTLRQLQAIRAIYERGQISAAAEALSVTQSAASVLLGQAEATLGTRLFDRTTRRVAPTQAVEQIIGIINRILADVASIDAVMTDLKELERGVVRIAATPATGIALLPQTVQRFLAAHPRIQLDMNDCAPDQFFNLIREEKVDFGVGIPPSDRSDFDWRVLHHDPVHLVCNRAHPLARRQSVPWNALDGEPLILARRNYGVRDQVEATIRETGGTPNLVSEIGFLYSAEWMVACGMGLAAFPARLARAIRNPEVVILPLVEPQVTRTLAVITRRGRSLSSPAQRFVDMLAHDLR